jgi:collagenase-like PrtC family protease
MEILANAGCEEVILAPWPLVGKKISIDEVFFLVEAAKKAGLKPLIEIDGPLFDEEIESFLNLLNSFPLTVRVFDPGLANRVLEKFPSLNIHLLLDGRAHNTVALFFWAKQFGNSLKRLVLSCELPCHELSSFAQKCPVPVEIMVFGRPILSFSRRFLLSPWTSLQEIKMDSTESAHRGLMIFENERGTAIFHPKILSRVGTMKSLTGIAYGFIDRPAEEIADVISCLRNEDFEGEKNLCRRLGYEITRGFARNNRTHLMFRHLKTVFKRDDALFLGEIMETYPKDWMVVRVGERPLALGQSVVLVTPDSKEREARIEKLMGMDGIARDRTSDSGLYFVNRISRAQSKARLYSPSR